MFRLYLVLFLLNFAYAFLRSCKHQLSMSTVSDTLGENNFKVLSDAIKLTGLDKTLSAVGPFTIFAPTDHAFANLPEGAIDGLWNNVPRLKDILSFHIRKYHSLIVLHYCLILSFWFRSRQTKSN